MTTHREFGLIPAAGKSRRMGRPKLALPLDDKTVLEYVVHFLKPPTLTDILVVLGPHVADLAPIAEKAGAQVLLLEKETADMRETIERGLDWIESVHQPSETDFIVLLPADHPCLDVRVLDSLRANIDSHPKKSIVVPVHDGKRGHPAYIQWKHVAKIRQWPRDQGLNTYFRSCVTDTMEVPVDMPSVTRDLDTPEDYQQLLNDL